MLIIYFACFELSENDKQTMLKSLNEEKHRTMVKNLEYIDEKLVTKSKKFRRRNKEQSKEEFIEF